MESLNFEKKKDRIVKNRRNQDENVKERLTSKKKK